MTVNDILQSYNEIDSICQINEGAFFFRLFEKQFLLILPSDKIPGSDVEVWLYNDEFLDYPHIMLREYRVEKGKDYPEGTYRSVCLYEQESVVYSIIPYEEKIRDSIDRLIGLLSMSQVQKEREFLREFMFYWNEQSVGKNRYHIYLQQDKSFAQLEVYYGKDSIRLIEQGLVLSDLDKKEKEGRLWQHHFENEAFFIPIIDTRGILPPHRGYKWTARELRDIVYGKQIKHIDDGSFQRLNTHVPKSQNIIFVFGMETGQTIISFALTVKCCNGVGHTLMEKVLNDVIDIEPLYTERKDYLYLCEQIGNDIGLEEKRILLAGAGSLGSYVAFELVKNGATQIDIYDDDKLEEENILRWSFGGIGKNKKKASTLQVLLNMIHPEIRVVAHDTKLDELSLIKKLHCTDMIIFTIGKSDDQLRLNKVLKMAKCNIPVIFVWLEEGGKYSHILYVNYQQQGCFNCLYTDSEGHAVNNRASLNSDDEAKMYIIRNGCGGTRAAYGTATLLRTTAALLDVIRDVETHRISRSTLYDITNNSVEISNTTLQMEACNCCGRKE